LSAVSAISPTRKAAFTILLAVQRGKSHSDERLRGKAMEALSPADRNLAVTLVLGVLRWQIRIDERIKGFLKKPGAKLDPQVLIALRLGAFQIEFLDRIPAHAAIDESVELTKHSGHRFASGMVNAVLRKLASATPPAGFSGESAAELASAYAHPAWMVERWARFYGLEAAAAICRHGQAQPALTVRIAGTGTEAALAHAGLRLEPGALLSAARIVVSGDLAAAAEFRGGRVRIQDEGSQLIGELAASAFDDSGRQARRLLDACAAPGGKTLILAERNPESEILACEASPPRFDELRKRLTAFSHRIDCRLADAETLNEEAIFDVALVDAPCSGTGTLGRNPEIRHRLRPQDLARHSQHQRALLRAALRSLRPGGRAVYSTCSLESEENEQVVSAVLAEVPNARRLSFSAPIESLLRRGIFTSTGADRLRDCLTPQGALLLLPGKIPADGFFAALIEKTA